MVKHLSTRYVGLNKSGERHFQSSRGRVRFGGPLRLAEEENVLLAGGFSCLSPQTPFFLSATLQLNGDLSDLSEDGLGLLAEAELTRFQSAGCASYSIDADPRVCVIGRDEAALDCFLDTYGGILEIEPLLMGGTTKHYSSPLDLSLEENSKGCRIRYTRRAPLRESSCHYCGQCAAVCPESCISPLLEIDFERCTFCKQCEAVCEDNIIDIHGIEEVVLEVPAVLLLEGSGVEIPENSNSVYLPNRLEDFFATLSPVEIEEVVCHNNQTCQHSGRQGEGCRRCVDGCPHGAIEASSSGIHIDYLRCRDCGRCVALCPTGAMQIGKFDDLALIRYLSSIEDPCIENLAGRELVVAEEHLLHRLWWQNRDLGRKRRMYLEYPVLQALSSFHLLLFYLRGFSHITLVCETEEQKKALSAQVGKANAITASLVGEKCFTVATIEAIELSKEDSRKTHPIPPYSPPEPISSRRAVYAGLVHHLLATTGKTLQLAQDESDFFNIDCDTEGCTQCLACLNACKMAALAADQENLALTFLASHCVGCGVCVGICPEKVLQLAPQSSIEAPLFQRRVLAQAEPVKCRKCGQTFGTRKSLDRVMGILSRREQVNTEHFEYCATCRVVKLFETEGAK